MLATLEAVQSARFEVQIAAPPTGPLADLLRDRGIMHLPWFEQRRKRLASLLQQAGPDLVHANSLSTARIAGPVVAEHGIPSLGHLRDILKLSRQAIADLNCHTRLVAVSNATRKFHLAQGLEADRTVVLHNGVDLHAFCPRERTGSLHRELNLPSDAILMVTIGQLGLRKGTNVVLEAATLVAPQFPEAHWLLVGERTSKKLESQEFENRLHQQAAKRPLQGHVHFLGNRNDVPNLLAECHLLVHAARQEPLGRVLLEAAATGLAIVATDVGGTREIFPDEGSGTPAALLVPVDDPRRLAEKVIALLRDEKYRTSLGHNGRSRAEEAFDISTAAARLVGLYRELLS